jgi:signal transduction histidine kinase
MPKTTGDSLQLFQIFTNLIQNAVHAMKDNDKLFISVKKVADEVSGKIEKIVIKFSDTGHGIPKEYINRIFDPFFTLKYGGTGLGLTIVHGIVEAHKGTIEVESVQGKGTTFTINLPFRALDALKT